MLTMDDIVRDGHPVLRKVASEVTLPPSNEDKKILDQLLEYVKNSQDPEVATKYGLRPGIGLAAPQINVSKRMIALINPKIISHSVEKTYLVSGEGCLSVDDPYPGYVPRYARITIKGYDSEGKELKLRLKGLPAICFQHEIDHLNGILFYDHINKENPMQKPENAIAI